MDTQEGYYVDLQTTLCLPCMCSKNGSKSNSCHEDGQCDCKEGVVGEKCDRCNVGYWGFSANGCKSQYSVITDCTNISIMLAPLTECDCFYDGTDGVQICNTTDGQCLCAEGIIGKRCSQCKDLVGHSIIENSTCSGMYCLLHCHWKIAHYLFLSLWKL